ncbi:MAG: alpha/beta fold hydrolase [Pseudomonadota bacterium]
MLEVDILGPIAVRCDGTALDLPSSRKTRALLAYLILSEERISRSALCDLLWDTTDDPRAALRWSLSKLRPILAADGIDRLQADRAEIACQFDDLVVDFAQLELASSSVSNTPDQAEALWQKSARTLLDGCELPEQHGFSAWINGQRNLLEGYKAALAKVYAADSSLAPDQRDKWAERWFAVAPFDSDAAQNAVATRHAHAGKEAASDFAQSIIQSFREADLPPPDFELEIPPNAATIGELAPPQDIRFVETRDHVSIAWASVGDNANPPLVKAANWLNHLELDWEAPIWSPLFRDLASAFHLVRYDERGCGLSDWDCEELTFESFVTDLEQVVEAAGLTRFPLLGISQGAAVSIEYAARHPEKVSHLILFGAYDCGWRHVATEEETREREAVMVLTETGWGSDNPAYRHLFSRTFMPDAEPVELDWFDEFQRQTTSSANAVRFLEAFSTLDVRSRLAEVQCPTLVVHSRGDQRIPLATGRKLATRIPGARFAGIDSNNHLLLGREPASAEFLKLVRDFLKQS